MPITRRRLLASAGAGVAGAGAATLAACGSDVDEPSSERDVELLQPALAAERSVANLYGLAAEQRLEPEVTEAVEAFGKQATSHVDRLAEAIESAGGEAAEPSGSPEGAESVVEAIALALDEAIGAYDAAVGELSTVELRRTVFELMTSDAAQLAAMTGVLGEDQAPDAFVTGATREPSAEEG
jgi:Ferritin-like domain